MTATVRPEAFGSKSRCVCAHLSRVAPLCSELRLVIRAGASKRSEHLQASDQQTPENLKLFTLDAERAKSVTSFDAEGEGTLLREDLSPRRRRSQQEVACDQLRSLGKRAARAMLRSARPRGLPPHHSQP